MKEAFIFPGPKVEIKDVDFPTLSGENYLIIKVAVAGSNPKDWAIAERGKLQTSNHPCPQLIKTLQFPA